MISVTQQKESIPRPEFSAVKRQPRPAADEGPVRLVLDYPVPNEPLFANVRTITGWCWSATGRIESIGLRIDGEPIRHGRTGYPRIDAVASGVPLADGLKAGFRFEFAPESLGAGEHEFEFYGSAGGQKFSRPITVHHLGDNSPIHVSDVFVDIVGFCNLRCVMCPQGDVKGIKSERPMSVMQPAQLDRILDHLQSSDCLTGTINLYNWGDPLLHPHLDRMLAVCAAYGQRVILSTNLAMPASHVQRLLRAETDLLMVSISGMTHETYARNHRGGRIDRVLENLELVAAAQSVGTILLKYLVFDYNRGEIEIAREFALGHGLEFGAYRGAIPSRDSNLVQIGDRSYASETTPFVGNSPVIPVISRTCPQESNIIVDSDGNLDVCAMSWRHRFGMSAATADLRQYLIHKMKNPTCSTCLAGGYAHYRHYDVIDPELVQFALSNATGFRKRAMS